MNSHTITPWRHALHAVAISASLACMSGLALAQDNTASALRPGEPVTLNFAGAEIEAVARAMASITGRNMVVDPRVKGQLTLLTDQPVSAATAFQQFLAALRLQGFTVVDSAGLYKVIPEADAKLQTSEVRVSQGGRTGSAAGSQIVTQIFKLNYESAANLVPVLRPLISPNNTINVNPGNNSLVITDYADNLQRLSRIVASMDVSNATDVEVIALQHAIAADMVPLITRLIEGGSTSTAVAGAAAGQSDSSFKTTLLAEPRSNALILRAANPARLAQVRSLVARLDQPAINGGTDQGNIHVVYLKNADAVALAATLRAAVAAQTSASSGAAGLSGGAIASNPNMATASVARPMGNTSGSGGGLDSMGAGASGPLGVSQQPSTGGMIQADPSTNSLIITAPAPVYRQLRAVIDKLDGRRAQVLVESLIVEVSANKLAEFGVQWQSVLGSKGSTMGVIGTNSGAGGGANIIDLTAGIAANSLGALSSIGGGLNMAVAPRINGQYYLGALAHFLQNSGDANVLSTPNLMTLDNEEAKIVIGNNVPFPTGSYANTTGSAGVNPFTTVERKDVGLMLRVRPQINENGTVKLSVYQEVSKVDESTLKNVNGPTTSKRSIESNVLVDDGSIIVLGGLLEDSYSQGEDRVPLLGDIPVVGNLFRNENRARKKTNLMVFLRPVVVRNTAASDALVQDRYEAIRALQQLVQPAPSAVMGNVQGAPLLPPLLLAPPADSGAGTTPPVAPLLIDLTQPRAPGAVGPGPGAL